ncbi:hypothetical protein [Novosphingobium lindaniclasticum]|uniref:Uncharacterized protein n=1 Tax=Novosphingobium lindaniclasticum LE124 TaxID=1096930 RepID=T0H250_9SPHN|nr:hypothetical protein [Novosphingobium lindaniclasticum]EQB10416.1 hypothetical protein L284_17135 [Novosphingobium lindaniclasticum LE124]
MATKTPPAETPKGTEVLSNDTMQIVDNTDVQVVEEAPVETEEVEILGGLVQINYK